MKKELLELFCLPEEDKLSEISVELLEKYEKDLDAVIGECSNYRQKVECQMRKKVYEPRMKELAQKLFDDFPDADFLATLYRQCHEDDSGNCWWGTEDWMIKPFPGLPEKKAKLSKEQEKIHEEIQNLFCKLYPNWTFDDETDAYWDGRAESYYGLTRNLEAVRKDHGED